MSEQFIKSRVAGTAFVSGKLFSLASLLILTTISQPINANTNCIDSDGDGWGWDGTQTCQINTAVSTTGICEDPDGDGWGWDGIQSCQISTSVTSQGVCEDPDGDGWGWDGVQSCQVSTAVTPTSACVDPDGDGWGWDGIQSCQVSTAVTPAGVCEDPDGDGWGWDGTNSCQVSAPVIPQTNTANVTDVLLMMGQSNALGENTSVDLAQDSPNGRVIAWTQFNGWQVANLCTQKWQKAWFPWRGGVCSNHPAFQIAKQITTLDPSRKVAVIPTGSAGKPISWWDANGIADQMVNATVQSALAALGKNKVDLIAWSQGEADHGNEAAWGLKLTDLIARLRQRPWFDAGTGQFIAQETKWSTVNDKVKELEDDGDPLTKWVPAADQPTKDGVHWSGDALRVISWRYASKYLF